MNNFFNRFAKRIVNHILKSGNNRYYRLSYSQDGEDVLLASFLEDKLIKGYKGFYVDIGAHHPKRFSNTQFYYERGWTGINIDCLPGTKALFDKERPNDTNLEIGISDKSSVLLYHRFEESALNTFDKNLADLYIRKGWKYLGTREIQCYNINDVLSKYCPEGQNIDFFTIDAEGLDKDIILSLDLEKIQPTYFLIESDLGADYQSSISIKMEKFKYKIVGKTYRTYVYKKVNKICR